MSRPLRKPRRVGGHRKGSASQAEERKAEGEEPEPTEASPGTTQEELTDAFWQERLSKTMPSDLKEYARKPYDDPPLTP